MNSKIEAADIAKEILISASSGLLQTGSKNETNIESLSKAYSELHKIILESIQDDISENTHE